MKKILLLVSIIYLLSLSLFSQSCQWVEKIGGLIYDDSRSIAVDSKGNVIVAGKFYSATLSFNNGITVNKVGDADVYLTKYDSNGTCLWAQVIGGEGEETVKQMRKAMGLSGLWNRISRKAREAQESGASLNSAE